MLSTQIIFINFETVLHNSLIMENLFKISQRLVSAIDTSFHRYLYDIINWDDRLILIKGARGVGKTTLLLQRIKERFGLSPEALYTSCDNLWFTDNKILDLVEYHYNHGGRHLFLDEIHLYEGSWQRELKNIYDFYPDYSVTVTGSSIIHLDYAIADLSRRCTPYQLYGLSFREYLDFKNIVALPPIPLEEMLSLGNRLARELLASVPDEKGLLPLFSQYIGKGYYPFFNEADKGVYYGRIERMLDSSIMRDFPAVASIEYETLLKIKKLLYVISREFPFQLNVMSLSKNIGLSRNSIIKMFDLLSRGAILRSINNGWRSPRSVAKPSKILFDNVDIMSALTGLTDKGTVRETFAASMLGVSYPLHEPPVGDLLVDEKYLFEIGGANKSFRQIANLPQSFTLVDDIEIGLDNRLPLWLLGFLY